MHSVILLTRFYELITTVPILSGGHVPQVPQWHDAPVLNCSYRTLQNTFTGTFYFVETVLETRLLLEVLPYMRLHYGMEKAPERHAI